MRALVSSVFVLPTAAQDLFLSSQREPNDLTCDPSTFLSGRTSSARKVDELMLDDVGDCCLACDDNPLCRHFTFEAHDQRCVLREGIADEKDAAHCEHCQLGWPLHQPGQWSPLSGSTVPPPTPPPPSQTRSWKGGKPHIIFFLGDDVGHYNFGWAGNPEARTPNMDRLVKEGVILDRHYVFQFCSPTRTSFLSGRLPVHSSTLMGGMPDANGVHPNMTTVAQKLTEKGYECHHLGKWHAGSAFMGQLPANKGFKSSLGYLAGNEDHYSQEIKGYIDFWDTNAPAYGQNGTYGGFSYNQRAMSIIEQHNPQVPLFIYMAFQNAHTPNQVPDEFLDESIDFDLRRTFEGMVHNLDSGLGNITQALKDKGMWENTLVVFSSDNGGRVDGQFGGNNWPLRGMKFSDFEGGIRAAAFVSGGIIPQARRNTVESGLIHVADWYATFCNLAGCESSSDPAAAGAAFPDVDSQDQLWTVINGEASPRQNLPLPISPNTLIKWPLKLIIGNQKGKGVRTGPQHPNGTKIKSNDPGCSKQGCLFDIEQDPSEFVDLTQQTSGRAHWEKKRQELYDLLSGLSGDFYEWVADVNGSDAIYSECVTEDAFAAAHENFRGPVCSVP